MRTVVLPLRPGPDNVKHRVLVVTSHFGRKAIVKAITSLVYVSTFDNDSDANVVTTVTHLLETNFISGATVLVGKSSQW